MKKLLMLLGIAFLVSCQKEDCGCVFVDIGVDMSITDADGTDLLNASNSVSLKESDIKLFHTENGILKEVVNMHAESRGDFIIFPVQNEKHRIRILTPQELTYIQYRGTDMDTMRCEFKKTENSTICTKVWYNSKLVFDSKNGTERYFVITK